MNAEDFATALKEIMQTASTIKEVNNVDLIEGGLTNYMTKLRKNPGAIHEISRRIPFSGNQYGIRLLDITPKTELYIMTDGCFAEVSTNDGKAEVVRITELDVATKHNATTCIDALLDVVRKYKEYQAAKQAGDKEFLAKHMAPPAPTK